MLLPAWSARTVQVPAPTMVIREPLVPPEVQTPADDGETENVTASPELAVALTVNGQSP